MGAVSYLNTKPLVYGFERGMMKDEIELRFDYPSNIAQMLLTDEIDIGLVPIAALVHLKEYHIVSDYCISSEGEVASVGIFSEMPLEKIEKLLLDYQSRTSVALAQILLKEYWKFSPMLENGGVDFINQISGSTAGVIIGDRALKQHRHSAYYYDLGLSWQQYTGLPFVFAAWVSNKPIPPAFIDRFNIANKEGLCHLNEIVQRFAIPEFDLDKYYNEHIKFMLNTSKLEAIALFLEKLKTNL